MDHDWGPRLTVFLREHDLDTRRFELTQLLRQLPLEVGGFSTRYAEFADDPGAVHMAAGEGASGGRSHRVEVTSVADLLAKSVGVRAVEAVNLPVWLSTPEQTFLELTSGLVLRDGTGELASMRTALSWYPEDIWRYRLAAGWMRIAQLAPFIGRTGEAGDDLGSQVIALALVRDLVRLTLLQERRYAPYPKWRGTAFKQSPIASQLQPHVDLARYATNWKERERGVVGAASLLAARQNALGLSAPVNPEPKPFFSRPYMVVRAEDIAEALAAAISDPAVRSLTPALGAIDDYVDSTDALANLEFRDTVRSWLRAKSGQ